MTGVAVALRDVFCVHRTGDGDAAALQGLSLEVAAGERVCVLGPSGAGKTTLLRLIAGLQRPSAGAVLVCGRDVGRLPARELAAYRRRAVGFLHQHAEAALAPDLRVGQSVALPLALRGVGRARRLARALDLLTAAGLAERFDAFPAQLSGGERQRVAVCAAVAHRPQLLLADEPTAELDAGAAGAVWTLIEQLAQLDGATVIQVSHDTAAARRATRTVRIRDGRVVEDRRGEGGSLVIGAGGRLALPADVLRAAGIGNRARALAVDGGVLLSPGAGDAPAPAPRSAASGSGRRCAPATVRLERIDRTRGRGADRRRVIADLTLSFAPARLTVVTGRSGAGKSTLLELLVGLQRPERGDVVIDDRPLTGAGDEQLAALRRTRIGYLPQEPDPIGFLSAEENVALALTVRGHSGPESRRRARAGLAGVGLADRRRRRVARLSAGEAQRVALARALVCANGLLVLDEPTSRLDHDNAVLVAGLLAQAAASEGHTVICATHDLTVIRQADQVVELGSGM